MIFLIFFISGFCGLLYQVVWLRLAFASFGVITPVLSVVVSIFMLGLGLGSWMGGCWSASRSRKISALTLYAGSEFLIGVGALAAPVLMKVGEQLLLSLGEMRSVGYLGASALFILAALLPWCFCMGMTFPLMMAAMRERGLPVKTSFSFLYLANTAGAMTGALVSAFILIELFGLQNTLRLAGVLNFSIAALCLTVFPMKRSSVQEKSDHAVPVTVSSRFPANAILFSTAFIAMASEVIWTRDFTPVMGTSVYAFAAIVAVYLLATWLGSATYRRHAATHRALSLEHLLAFTCLASFLPIIVNNPRFELGSAGALISFFPFCVLLGYFTPQLIDHVSEGSSGKAGTAYAVNIAGSMAGPLLASYVLLPFLGAKLAMLTLTLPLLLLHLRFSKNLPRRTAAITHGLCLVLAVAALASDSYEDRCRQPGPNDRIARDYTATVLCCNKGWDRQILVNGIGMTRLAFVTKEMAHLPLGCFPGKPQNALMICFGMGTTYRSLLSWNIHTTAVELVPSVPRMFDFFFTDADTVRQNPLGTIVNDDGRRFLRRTHEHYDLITLDPPPPVESSGSGLLYSPEFYDLVKSHLSPDGLLQQWWPEGEERILQAVARSLVNSFPYVRVFKGRGQSGFHFLAAMKPIQVPSAKVLESRLPPGARQDIREWAPEGRVDIAVQAMLSREIPLQKLLPPDRDAEITDDRPYNEYYILRRFWDALHGWPLVFAH